MFSASAMLMAACAPSPPPVPISPTVPSPCKRALAAGGCLASPVAAAASLLVESSRVLPCHNMHVTPGRASRPWPTRLQDCGGGGNRQVDSGVDTYARGFQDNVHASVGNGSPPTGPLGDHGFQDIFPLLQPTGACLLRPFPRGLHMPSSPVRAAAAVVVRVQLQLQRSQLL